MALEASIVERLQELRKWQIDQQERLLKQQQEQRELLSIEQERMYEALGLSMKDVIVDESIIDEMSVSKITQHVDEFKDSKTNHEKNGDESQDTPNITRQSIITSNTNSPIFNDSEEQLGVQLNVPNVCLKAFETDLTISDSSNYQNLPSYYKLQIENNNEGIDETPKRFRRNHFELSVKGIEPLEPDKPFTTCVPIDELPVPSPKKDFKTLLEEKLRDDETANTKSQPKNHIKRPFLRKGEGLSRFRMNSAANKVKKPMRLRPTSRFMNSPSNKSTKPNMNNVHQKEKSKVNTKDNKGNEVVRRSVGTIPNVAQQKLILSNVALPKKAVRNSRSLPSTISTAILPSKSNGLPEQCLSNDESNQSDLDTSKLETKMFEMLEEKAENSSFCSTSSAVIAFMQQSTPIKLKNIRKNLPPQKQTMNGSIERTNDNILNEIVHTLKSNQLEESAVMQIRETYAQKDIVMSKWDSGPFTNDQSQSGAKNTQQNIRKFIQPINHKNSQLHHHNNNKIVKANYSEPEERQSNLSSSTEIDCVYENNCHNELNNPLHNNCKDTESKSDANVSMHVRFAEFNEYKTIGLTDTSTLSTDSQSIAIHDNEENWSDHSDSEESSDSEILSSKEEIVNQQRLLNDPSKHMNPSADQYNHINANFMTNNKMTITSACNDNTENSDSNSVDQSTDDENSVFNDSEGTYYDEDTTISGIQETMAKVLSVNNNENDSAPTDKIKLSTQSKLSESNDTIFKSDLLKNRLLELEREIDIFRKENAALALQRQTIQDEHRQLQREFKEKEANLERERIQMNMTFQEEKKRLAREKSALENRLRDAREKSIQSKHEREEIQMLNEQLDELREDMAEKESRWQAAQARQRSQTRVLQMENSKLKLEIEKFQSTKRVNGKLKRPSVISNTKSIHQINKQLDGKRGTLHNDVAMSDEELETAKIIHKKTSNPSVSSNSTNHNSLSNTDTGKVIAYNAPTVQKPVVKPTEESISKKRQLYETLLKDASIGYHQRNYEKSPIIPDNNNDKFSTPPSNYEIKKDVDLRAWPTSVENEFTAQQLTDSGFQHRNELPHSGDDSEQCNGVKKNDEKMEQVAPTRSNAHLESQQSTRGSYQQFIREIINPRNDTNQSSNFNPNGAINARNSPDVKNQYQQLNYSSDKIKLRSDQVPTYSSTSLMNKQNEKNDSPVENESAQQVKETKMNYGNNRMKLICPSDSDLTPRKEHQDPLPRPSDDMTPRAEEIQVSQICDSPKPKKINSSSTSSTTNHNIREVKHPDGHTEYWYPNGNVKRIYPDRKITKMIYYNGDVRETLSDGCIKYFYAATKTWHTTYPDGFEILEFPDGQQERRTKDGVVEVSFPDGSVRLMQPDGIEKWALPDGTIAETFPNGEKILSLPNGQREIHTTEHKRREYPDGTVKFVYPDGIQETRYSNGRIRIKDKDGNLVMDSHQA